MDTINKGGVEDAAAHDGANQEPKKKGIALIVHDFKQKPLIPVKILFFVMFSSKLLLMQLIANYVFNYNLKFGFKGIGVLAPYLTIHMKSLGITVEETAIIYGVVPLFGLIAPSTMGMVADKLGNFKVNTIAINFITKKYKQLISFKKKTGSAVCYFGD